MKKQILTFITLVSAVMCFSLNTYANKPGAPKKFKRALIIAGGGIAPGVGLGLIAGAKKMGWNPDLIITTCGGSMSGAITNSIPHMDYALEYAKGPRFFDILSQISIDTKSVFAMQKKFEQANDVIHIPQYFKGNVLALNDEISGFLPLPYFARNLDAPKIIMLAAKANFGPQNVGQAFTDNRFTQVFFTDSQTANSIRNLKSPVKKLFPDSYLTENTLVVTDVSTEQAARASIADPYLINPGKINGEYYFTGAVDLIPIELATQLADEVIVTYPTGLFDDFENAAIQSTFGFNQTQRVLHAIQSKDVKWIDLSDASAIKFDPAASMTLTISNNIPKIQSKFAEGIQEQYDLGFSRVQEALTVQANHLNVRSHIRKPINPKLLKSFTCENANEWKTIYNTSCTQDFWQGCNRNEPTCTPIR
ncbi:MAG: patatin-like phospholipase family protein [Pseudobdellovibrionaceae bacterium]